MIHLISFVVFPIAEVLSRFLYHSVEVSGFAFSEYKLFLAFQHPSYESDVVLNGT